MSAILLVLVGPERQLAVFTPIVVIVAVTVLHFASIMTWVLVCCVCNVLMMLSLSLLLSCRLTIVQVGGLVRIVVRVFLISAVIWA